MQAKVRKERQRPLIYYIALCPDRIADDGSVISYEPDKYGGYPRFLKTHRGASRRAGNRGKVVAIDLLQLPQVNKESYAWPANMSEYEFAEAQSVKWAELAEQLKNK